MDATVTQLELLVIALLARECLLPIKIYYQHHFYLCTPSNHNTHFPVAAAAAGLTSKLDHREALLSIVFAARQVCVINLALQQRFWMLFVLFQTTVTDKERNRNLLRNWTNECAVARSGEFACCCCMTLLHFGASVAESYTVRPFSVSTLARTMLNQTKPIHKV